MRITAKVDYAIRACAELAGAPADRPTKGHMLAEAQCVPLHFLENILRELRQAEIVQSVRGAEGGYLLARPANEINLAQIIRAVEGPLAAVQGVRPDRLEYTGAATDLRVVWLATRASLRSVLERVTLADLAGRSLPDAIRRLAETDD